LSPAGAAIRFDFTRATVIGGGMGHDEAGHQKVDAATAQMKLGKALSPSKAQVWRHLTPGERLHRSWQMRSRIPDWKAVPDRKLFPKP